MRRSRESIAKGHGTPPLIVEEMDPIDDHPGLGKLVRRKIRRLTKRVRAPKQKVKVEIEVKTGGHDDGETD